MHLVLAVIPIITSLQFEECRHSEQRQAALDIDVMTALSITAGAGSLRVEGRPGLRQARIRGTACASSRDLLDEIRMETGRTGSEIVLKANHDDLKLRGRAYARLDLVIEVPQGFHTRIDDGEGAIELYDLGDLDIIDGSGEITVQDAAGNVSIRDGSGEVQVTAVKGDVAVEDGSGDIDIHGVGGGVDISDSSGEVRVTGVTRDVVVRDGSGGIDVENVGGSFTVESDGSGGVDYRDVQGDVNMPTDFRFDRGRKKLLYRFF